MFQKMSLFKKRELGMFGWLNDLLWNAISLYPLSKYKVETTLWKYNVFVRVVLKIYLLYWPTHSEIIWDKIIQKLLIGSEEVYISHILSCIYWPSDEDCGLMGDEHYYVAAVFVPLSSLVFRFKLILSQQQSKNNTTA